jgi:phosphoglycerate dehydrogenase-like enzyme
MKNAKLIIWCNNDFSANDEAERLRLKQGVGENQLLLFDYNQNGSAGVAREALDSADIAFGYPDPVAVSECDNLKWVHLHSAGYTSFDQKDLRATLSARGTILTNSSAVYDEPCAQHLLAMIMSLARQLPAALESQRQDRSWKMVTLRDASRLLNDQTVLILGFGAIARRLVELLRPLQMNLIALRRKPTGDESIRVVDISRIDEFLPLTDHLVNILPDNDQTRNFLDSSRLSKLKEGAIVYNIGRGSTLDQTALLEKLNFGQIAAAYLDVTSPEPLPPDHPLWTTPNCFITPHSAGGHSNEKERQVDHFLSNLRRFEQGEPLLNRVL